MAAILNMATGFFRAYGFARVALSYRAMRGKAVAQAFGKVNFPNGLFFRCLSPLSRKQSPVDVQGGAGDIAGLVVSVR
jgi:hypothetical protein